MQWSSFTDGQLEQFVAGQRRSFEIQREVAGRLATGVTERQATTWMLEAYRSEGVESFFHLPVALFGERTTLPDPWTIEAFWPTTRQLQPGEPFILDASPVLDGFLVDTSTTGVNGAPSEVFRDAVADDRRYRETILDAVRNGATFREIAVSVDREFAAGGYRNCHRLHPGEVLGHRVGHVPDAAAPDELGFARDLVDWFFAQVAGHEDPAVPAPTWSDGPGSDHLPADGLWAVEPHLGTGAIGAKWEEILVIDSGDAYWLDDEHLAAAFTG